jgi:hypothetical protein
MLMTIRTCAPALQQGRETFFATHISNQIGYQKNQARDVAPAKLNLPAPTLR